MNKVWINGKLIDMNKASISIFDRGFMYGDGVFETMRSYDGEVFMIDEHLRRLARSLKTVAIKAPYSREYLKKEICRLISVNRLKEAYIRLTVTRGEGRFGIEHKDILKPNVVIIAKKFEGYPKWMIDKGISCRTVRIRQNELSPLSGVKSLNFLNYILARFEAKDEGADEAIVLNTKGYVAESPTSNIFMVKGKTLITPTIDSGALPGITRDIIMRLAKKLGLRIIEKRVSHKELIKSDEVFLTNTLAEILPVTLIDRRKVGSGVPGPITELLLLTYHNSA